MRDLYSNIATALALAPAVQAATVNGPAVDVRDASGAVIALSTGAIVGAGSFSAKLQESDDGTTGWADVPAKWVQSNAPAPLAASSTYRIGYTGKRGFIRLVLTQASGTSIAAGAAAALRPLVRPVI
jgi:hypothetical protein